MHQRARVTYHRGLCHALHGALHCQAPPAPCHRRPRLPSGAAWASHGVTQQQQQQQQKQQQRRHNPYTASHLGPAYSAHHTSATMCMQQKGGAPAPPVGMHLMPHLHHLRLWASACLLHSSTCSWWSARNRTITQQPPCPCTIWTPALLVGTWTLRLQASGVILAKDDQPQTNQPDGEAGGPLLTFVTFVMGRCTQSCTLSPCPASAGSLPGRRPQQPTLHSLVHYGSRAAS